MEVACGPRVAVSQQPGYIQSMDAPKKRAASRQKMKVEIDEVAWYPVKAGAFCADVYNDKAGEILLEAGPGPDGRFFAQAHGFLGVTIWKRQDFDSLNEAQIQVITWWKNVTYDTTPAAPAAPAKRRPGRPRSQKKAPARKSRRSPSNPV